MKVVEGGRKQEPGSPIYNVPMKPEQARETLAGMPSLRSNLGRR